MSGASRAAQSLVLNLPRHRAPSDGRRIQVVDYRHFIHGLRCKPMALLHRVYRDALFLRSAYRAAWERLIEACDARVARRAMLELLALAHERSCEAVLAVALTQQLLEGGMPDLAILRTRFAPSVACSVTDVHTVFRSERTARSPCCFRR
jgi:hypothetical protein